MIRFESCYVALYLVQHARIMHNSQTGKKKHSSLFLLAACLFSCCCASSHLFSFFFFITWRKLLTNFFNNKMTYAIMYDSCLQSICFSVLCTWDFFLFSDWELLLQKPHNITTNMFSNEAKNPWEFLNFWRLSYKRTISLVHQSWLVWAIVPFRFTRSDSLGATI